MKFHWPIFFLLIIPVLSQSQNRSVDSLIKLLPSLKDSSRINCLNKLGVEYHINALDETYINVQTDTALLFASKAYAEAAKIHYNKGIAEALQNLGEIARDRGEFNTAENYFRQSIPFFGKIHAMERYSLANLRLGWSLYKQCRFLDARLAYERAMPYYIATGNKEKQSMLLRTISYTYRERGYYEKAFEIMLRSISITYKIKDTRGVISAPEVMGWLYRDAGETETALTYYRLAAQNAQPTNPVRYNNLMGDISILLNQLDSAIYIITKRLTIV